jgi:hypothetical protein
MFSIEALKFIRGQEDGSCNSHYGPRHHNVDMDNIVGLIPLEIRSAELDSIGTCRQHTAAVSSCILATLLPTNAFHVDGGNCIHVSTM